MISNALFLTLAGVFWSIGETSRLAWTKNMLTSALGMLLGHLAWLLVFGGKA